MGSSSEHAERQKEERMYLFAANLGSDPELNDVCVLGAVLQGSSREEPCRAFAVRSWRWSIKSKVKSCGSQPARCRRAPCWEMAAACPAVSIAGSALQ